MYQYTIAAIGDTNIINAFSDVAIVGSRITPTVIRHDTRKHVNRSQVLVTASNTDATGPRPKLPGVRLENVI